MDAQKERTFIMIKPDGVQRGLVGEIIGRFERKGFKLVGLKFAKPTKDQFEKHYADLKDKPFFPGLLSYMQLGPVCQMVWEGTNSVATGRKMLGQTKPFESAPGTIRGDFAIDVGRNICHGSDSVDTANKEIALWFGDNELFQWTNPNHASQNFKSSGEGAWIHGQLPAMPSLAAGQRVHQEPHRAMSEPVRGNNEGTE